MPDNIVQEEQPQMTSQYGAYTLHAVLQRLHALIRMHTPTRPGTHIHAGTQAHAYQLIMRTAFPQQQWFRERASVLRYTYIVCLVPIVISCKNAFWRETNNNFVSNVFFETLLWFRDTGMEANVAELLDCAYISWFVIFVHHRIYDSVLRGFHTIQ
jgi:hypothetical protein